MEDHYALVQEGAIGPYTVQLWQELGLDYCIGPSDEIVGQLAAILKDGRPYALHWDAAVWLRKESGTDLTGEGNPDLVLALYSGGAHCCMSTIVYDLGDTPTKVLETPYEDAICEGYFQDLDGDGVPEFITCDTSHFFFGEEPFLFSCYNWPGVRIVLRHDPARGYVTASPQFAEGHQKAIAEYTEQAERAEVECEGRHMCDAVMVAVNYLYTDRPDEASSEFSRLYKCPNAPDVWDALVKAIIHSPSQFYAPRDAPKAVVRWPSYYMLQLSMHANGRLPIAFLERRRPIRYIPLDWLEALLRDIDLVVEGEGLELFPEPCTAECSIAVVDRSAGTQVGTICLDVSSGFPGEVYRVDDVESDHWRLKGDLTWERVPSRTPSPMPTPIPTPTLGALGDTWTRSTDGMVMVYVPPETTQQPVQSARAWV